MKLVIVESPNKCSTISKYLGKGYTVLASKGHIRDLATRGKDGLGVDVLNNFAPTYIISSGKDETIKELLDAKRKSEEVILATDPDREGEAIAWHLSQVLGLDPKTTPRLEFHEITKESINAAILSPRTIDMNLVNSQETRRIMDRIIGFKLSTLLKKNTSAQSAGRVQSATLKLICDHEKEILNFKPEEYWNLSLEFEKDKKTVKADYYKFDNEVFKLVNKDANDVVLNSIGKEITVVSLKKTSKKIESKPPFTTSTMQQEAFNVYKFSTAKTTKVAQELYEGLSINGEHVGLVTYIRTDSTNLSDTYVAKTLQFIKEKYGEEYVGHRKGGKKAMNAQEAHEAIRPTSNYRTPESLRSSLTLDQYKLYKLIYERAIASLMAARVDEVTTAILKSNNVSFKCEGTVIIFPGYTKSSGVESKGKILPPLKEGESFVITKINNEQKFTEPPARYNEGKIVNVMEEKGIGRPSTYASTIATLKKREYIETKGGLVTPTEMGMNTSIILNKYFPDIVDDKYTASMEIKLDQIQEGTATELETLTHFYYPFIEEFKRVSEIMYKDQPVETGELCPKCGKPLVIKKGRFGEFVACSNYPTCNYIKKEEPKIRYTGQNCPECGRPLVIKTNKQGREFVGCSGYPTCNYIQKEEKPVMEIKVIKKCPACGGDLIIKKGPYSKFLGCTNYPTCKYQEKIKRSSYKK